MRNTPIIKMLAIALTLILSFVLVAGCTLIPEVETAPPSTEVTPLPGPPTGDNTTPTSTSAEPIPPASDNATSIDSGWTVPARQGPAATLPSIADVVARVKPSVVAINSEVTTRDFFDRTFTEEVAVGSGWIIDEEGYVVTNNHVAQAAAPNIIVILDDGRAASAEIVGTDELTDLAVLKIDAENLTAAAVGDSNRLRVGDWVVAIGNSLGRGIRATQGIVSRQGASVEVDRSQRLYGLIETDAAINPGNSGGPLVNMAGEVIGITSAKLAAVEVEGTGYAISNEVALSIIWQLINAGRAVHPWLGVSLYPISQYVVERFNLAVDQGALVVEVVADSPAGKAGLQEEDVIVAFAGEEIKTVDDLIIAIRASRVGQEVAVTYWRSDTEYTTSITLSERPSFP